MTVVEWRLARCRPANLIGCWCLTALDYMDQEEWSFMVILNDCVATGE